MSKSVSLLISILVRYPEVGSLHYDPQEQAMRFTFLLAQALSEADFAQLEQRLAGSLDALSYLESRPPRQFRLERSVLGDHLTMIEMHRDVGSLTQEEISLVITLIRSTFRQELIIDPGDSLYEDELALQDEMIEQMLEDLRDSRSDRRLVAFREEGRVLVFNQ